MTDRQPPNVLIILADQLRGHALGCAGDPNVHSPHFDRLAAEGVLVENSFTTDPVCTPARAALLTGRYPHTTGTIQNNLRLPEDEVTFAEVLRERGYSTGYIGKWHLDGPERPGFVPPGPRRQGFDYWAGFNRGHAYWDSVYFRDTDEPIHAAGYEPDYQTDLALDFIRSRTRGEGDTTGAARQHGSPFCLFLSWGPPHTPLNPPPEFRARYDAAQLTLRPNVPAHETQQAREELAGYYGHISALDANLGRLLDELDRLDIAGSTLVIVTSDHGDLLGSHGYYRKGQALEESVRVPLLMRWPGTLTPGIRPPVLASSVDFAPTLLGLCGVQTSAPMQGRDLSPWLLDAAVTREDAARGVRPALPAAPDAVLLEGRLGTPGAWRALRTRRYTLIHHVTAEPGTRRWQLFDLENDPYQLRDLHGDPASAEIERTLQDQLHRMRVDAGDTVGTL